MAYSKTIWSTGEAITQARMQNIEDGIEAATITAEACIKPTDTVFINLQTEVGNLRSDVGASDSEGLRRAVIDLRTDLRNSTGENSPGQLAWTQVYRATEGIVGRENESYTSLDARFYLDETALATNIRETSEARTWIQNAAAVNTVLRDGQYVKAGSLSEKIADIDRKIQAVVTTNTDISNLLNPTDGSRSYTQRLFDIDDNTVPSMSLPEVITELSNARGTNSSGGNNLTLSDRFTQDETRIGSNETDIGQLKENTVKHSDVKNDFSSTDTDNPLSAGKGKELRDMIGGSYTASNTVASHIGTAATNAETNAKTYADDNKVAKSNIYNGIDYVPDENATDNKVLDARQGKVLADRISSELDTENTGLKARMTAAELAINHEKDQSNANDKGGLEQRMDVAEEDITDINNKLGNNFTSSNTVEQAIATAKQEAISTAAIDATTKAGTAETNAKSYADGLIYNGLDKAETGYALDATQGKALNDIITDSTTGLSAVKTIADRADTAAANANDKIGTGFNSTNTISAALATKADASAISDLAAYDTIVISKENNTSNLNSNNKPNIPIEDIVETADYLIEHDDLKYYYWRYINGQWCQISGGGGSGGTGNNNAAIYNTFNDFINAAKEVNKDYYVLQNGKYHHYRYLSTEQNAEPIEIGTVIDTSNIKTYNMALRPEPEQSKNYLDIYQFDYGISNAQLDDGINGVNIINSIELPEGMGGGSATANNVCKVIQVGDPAIRTISQEEAKHVELAIFYQAYEMDEDQRTWQNASYTLYRNDMIIDSGNFKGNTAAKNIDPNGTWEHIVDGEVVTETNKDNPIYWVTFDVTQFCEINTTNNFKLVVLSENNIQRTRYWEIEVVALTISPRDFSANTIQNANANLNIGLTMIGANGERYIEAIVDGDTANKITKSTNETASFITIPSNKLSVGAHKVDIRFGQFIGENIERSYSDTLSLDIICRDKNNDDQIILASQYRNVYPNEADLTIDQYAMVEIPYNLYVPNNESVTIQYTNNMSNQITYESLTTGSHTYRFKASDYTNAGQLNTATISCIIDETVVTSITIKFFITKSEYEIVPTTDSLVFDFNPEGYTNNTVAIKDRLWIDENNSNIKLSTNNTFDWVHGGWGYDTEEDAPYFCIKAGSRATINYPLFEKAPSNSNSQNNTDGNGSSFKCIFKVANVSNPEAIFLRSIDETPSTIVNYGSDKLSSKQSLEELKADTLFSNYLNVKEYHIIPYDTKKQKLKTDDTIVAFSVLPNMGDIVVTEATINSLKSAAEEKAFNDSMQMSYDNIHSLLYIPQENESDDNAYDATIAQRQALNALFNDEDLKNKSTVSDIMTTLAESEDWAEYRTTRSYNLLYSYLDNLVKKVLIIDYTHWEVITSNNFESQSFINTEKFPAYTNEINKKDVRNIRVTPTDSEAGQPTIQIDIEYTDVVMPTNEDPNHKERVYGQILAIRTIDSVLEQGRGLEMRAHRSNLYLNNGTLTYPYAEEDVIEYEYNVHALDESVEGKKYTSYILAYEDGVPSASILYPVKTNALKQKNPGQLILGSDDCDVYIYRMKFYDKELSNKDILQNFCADALNSEDAVTRYKNNIKTYTSPENNTVAADPDSISPISIAKACPDLRVIMIEAPSFTTSKNNYVKNTTIRCIKTGTEEGRDPAEDNWIAYNAYHAGQGTSSDAYGAAGRNIDIIFAFNGTDEVVPPKAKNTYRFDKNYKSIIVKGIPVEQAAGSIQTYETYLNTVATQNNINRENDPDAYAAFIARDHIEGTSLTIDQNGTGAVSLSETSVPNNWFNIKLNIASSENANNALLQKRYDRYLKEIIYNNTQYKNFIPAMKRDPYVKNDMEFFNTIVFIRETDPSQTNGKYTKHSEFNDCNWHFYGIGNIGDSKKTDKTRANIPNDPYEFCVEISDNGLINSGFSSGVWYEGEDENHNKIGAQYTESNYGLKYPISYAEWTSPNNTVRKTLQNFNEEDEGWQRSFEFRYDPNTKDGSIVTTDPAEKAAVELFQIHNREIFANMYEWVVTAPTTGNESFIKTLKNWFLEPSPLYWYLFTERYTMIDSRAKNTFYHYGKIFISDDEYNIITKEKDGTSYETTQAIFDHETNITNLQAQLVPITAQIASLKEQIAALDKATQQEDINALNAQLAPIQAQSDEINWNIQQEKAKKQNAEYIMQHRDWFTHNNAEASQNDGYRFDLWDYDNDTALGINNNGKMVFDAGIEDIDKINNVWVYNEATSVFWCRIRDEGYDKLVELYSQLKDECFSAEHLIGEFDTWQNQFPENLWRMDFERKYRRPYQDGGEVTYLRDMANGRKKYQRREFERNMSVYIHSKYDTTGNYLANDELSFRPVDRGYQINNMSEPGMIGESQIMTIVPYSKIYINMSVGNTVSNTTVGSVHQRAEAGQPYTYNLKNMVDKLQNIQCRVFNASRIQELSGLEHYYPDDLKVAAAKKLKKITVGTDYVVDANGDYIRDNNGDPVPYINDKTTTIELGTSDDANPILETLDLRNCTNLATTFNLQGSVNLKYVYAYGTPITEFNFANNGLLTELYLPTTIQSLVFNNLHLLNKITTKTFKEEEEGTGTDSYLNLNTYISTNSSDVANSQYIVSNALNSLNTINLDNINWQLTNLPDFESFDQKRKALAVTDEQGVPLGSFELAGNITITKDWSEIAKTTYTNAWNNTIRFITDPAKETYQTKVIYMESGYESDTGTVEEYEIETRFVNGGDPIVDLYSAETALNKLRQRPPTIGKIFQFGDLTNQNKYRPYSGWSKDAPADRLEDTLYGQGYRMMDDNYFTASSAQSETIKLYTYYGSEAHKYTVQWRLTPDQIIPTTNPVQDYEGGYNLEAPTIAEIRKYFPTVKVIPNNDDEYEIQIFKQWEKLPTNIHPTLEEAATSIYTINGEWETQIVHLDDAHEDNLFNNTTNITPEQLLMLSRLDNTARNKSNHTKVKNGIVAQKKFNYRMGYEGRPNTGILLADDTSNTMPIRTFDEDTSSFFVTIQTSEGQKYITPFSSNKGFTLVLDYSFDSQTENGSAAVLVGCYAKPSNNSSVTGFALYNNYSTNLGSRGISVGYGDMFNVITGSQRSSVAVGDQANLTKRNIVVIRHPKDSSDLVIYTSRASNNSSDLNDTVNVQTISLGSQVLNSDAKLCFGGLRSDLTSSFINNHPEYTDEYSTLTRAYGTIYWAKYWDEDLGAGECRELAAWPHENMTAIIADINNTSTAGTRPSIYFNTLNGSDHYSIDLTSRKFSGGGTLNNPVVAGWNDSAADQLCKKRVFSALPHKLQAIINQSYIGYMNYVNTEVYDDYIDSYKTSTYLDQVRGTNTYVYMPSISSINSEDSEESFVQYNGESITERNGTSTGSNRNITPYPWISGANGVMTVYENYSSNNPHWTEGSADYSYLNLRFPCKPISFSASNKMRVFKVRNQDVHTPNKSFKTIIDQLNVGLKENDIVIYDNAAYIYVTANDIMKYGFKTMPQDSSDSEFNTGSQGGGWIKSIPYMTRSVTAKAAGQSNFIFIKQDGSIGTPTTTGTQPGIVNLNYSFTI